MLLCEFPCPLWKQLPCISMFCNSFICDKINSTLSLLVLTNCDVFWHCDIYIPDKKSLTYITELEKFSCNKLLPLFIFSAQLSDYSDTEFKDDNQYTCLITNNQNKQKAYGIFEIRKYGILSMQQCVCNNENNNENFVCNNENSCHRSITWLGIVIVIISQCTNGLAFSPQFLVWLIC